MKNIAVLTNCQGEVIKNILKEHLKDNVTFFDVPLVHTIAQDEIKKDEVLQLLNDADLIITQPLGNYFTSISLKNIKEKLDKNLFVFPSIYFQGYNPEMFYFKNLNGFSNLDFPAHYHDLVIFIGYMKKLTKKQLVDIFYDDDFYYSDILKKMFDDSILTLQEYELECDLSVSSIIENNKTKKLFYTCNHPTTDLLNYVSRNILDYLDYTGTFTPAQTALDWIRYPSYASVAKFYGYDFESMYHINGREFSREEMIEQYFDFYDSRSDTELEYNLNYIMNSRGGIYKIIGDFMREKF
ncbi:WcbI family polysaccharide biosynthesis putative acetyltransferase [Sulfurimonas sp. HSL-1716]|uniref:WcbI family polysaccharide biosynthesis putative acetyltransferase n=1 Tax=Hydrocurvibacter sulfurireducens TaxID=3131937 RepID=UPI0031F91685